MNKNESTEQKPRLVNPNDWNEKATDPRCYCTVPKSCFVNSNGAGCNIKLTDAPYMFQHKDDRTAILCPDCFLKYAAPTQKESIQTIIAPQDLFRIPDSFDDLSEAGRFLMSRDRNERRTVQLSRSIPGHPYDVAYQLAWVIRDQFGFTDLRSTFGFFESKPPTFITVQTSETETADIYIGEFSIPGMNDSVVNTAPNGSMTELNISIKCQQRHKGIAQTILNRTADRVINQSIYRGKALTVTLGHTPQGNPYLNPPKFLPLPKTEPRVFLDSETTAKVATLQTLIEKTTLCKQLGISTKHGALFHGVYGTGKTLTSQRLAWHAVRNDWTYIYCKDTQALSFVMPFVSLYENVVLFAEDIERAAEDTELQNILDGVQSKAGRNLILILTTNHKDDVPLPLRRPGRFDSVIEFRLPNADVAGRLAELFAGRYCGFTAADVGSQLAGLSPAMIRAIVDGAKIAALGRVESTDGFQITSSDIAVSRSIYDDHIAYCSDAKPEKPNGYTLMGDAVGRMMAAALLHGGTIQDSDGENIFSPPAEAIEYNEQYANDLGTVKV